MIQRSSREKKDTGGDAPSQCNCGGKARKQKARKESGRAVDEYCFWGSCGHS